jgi:hypothetical protein
LAAALAALACACTSPGTLFSQPIEARAAAARAEPAPEPTLYARDGTPVGAGAAGTAEAAHALRDDGGSRMYLLELYQEAVDRREALELELAALNGELARSRDLAAARDEQLAAAAREREALVAERDRLAAENDDLAARLVTAQIRRLEAEKLLLEAKLEWLRAEETREEPPPAAATNGGGRR